MRFKAPNFKHYFGITCNAVEEIGKDKVNEVIKYMQDTGMSPLAVLSIKRDAVRQLRCKYNSASKRCKELAMENADLQDKVDKQAAEIVGLKCATVVADKIRDEELDFAEADYLELKEKHEALTKAYINTCSKYHVLAEKHTAKMEEVQELQAKVVKLTPKKVPTPTIQERIKINKDALFAPNERLTACPGTCPGKRERKYQTMDR